jgi:hypothetical protein
MRFKELYKKITFFANRVKTKLSGVNKKTADIFQTQRLT